MKKIKLIIAGVSLILLAISFNLSIVSDIDSDINLSSLINVALANAEQGGGAYEEVYTYTFSDTHTYKNSSGKTCSYTVSGSATDCLGVGDIECETAYESTTSATTCS